MVFVFAGENKWTVDSQQLSHSELFRTTVNSHHHTALVLALGILLLISGCSSIDSLTGGGSGDATPTETPATTTHSPSPTYTQIVKTAPGPETEAPPETWTKPVTPRDPEDKRQNRITNAKFINKKSASNGGYTDFDIEVRANTSLEDVDPTPDIDGEPYFVVEINGKLIAREDAYMRQDDTFTLNIHPDGLKQFDPGTLSVRVTLYDEDHKHDDRYDVWTGTIEYAGDA